ncbi:MAG TPA: hypothetical protein VGQ20_05990 [Acidimicrobiales bacterium]|jgi:hypothetical protein|nr:hypothetical protein [Acidimicrobiales bacterium]
MPDVHDEQERAEALDPDELSDDDDPTGSLDYPAERPLGVGDYGTTAQEERIDEPLEDHVARELPERRVAGDRDARGRVGRLVEPGAEDDAEFPEDDEADAVATSVPEFDDASAEEAAIHETAEPAYREE